MKSFKTNEIFEIKSQSNFEELALKIFDYQNKNNNFYSEYSSFILKGKKPTSIREIPFLPISFFKTNKIILNNLSHKLIFKSSGTSGARSSHYVADLELYKKSFINNFVQQYHKIEDTCIIGLLPSYEENGDSSLIYMINELISISQNKLSGFYNNNFQELNKSLKTLESSKTNTILIGVSYALLDFGKEYPQKLKNTIVIETGGMKGKRKEILKEELHKILKDDFGLNHIHSEYGMTELLSQAYSKKDGVFLSPSWMDILIRDINDPLSILGFNKLGGVNIIDLANLNSCSFIATDDLGIKLNQNEFKINGRLSNSDMRGCNLLIQ